MIDLNKEQLIRLSEVPKILPKRQDGKRVHISAIYRWAQRGVKGVRLETLKIGGTTYTSREALQRFASAPVNQQRGTGRSRSQSKQRQHNREQVDRRVQDILHRKV
jgi:hypothetical protein